MGTLSFRGPPECISTLSKQHTYGQHWNAVAEWHGINLSLSFNLVLGSTLLLPCAPAHARKGATGLFSSNYPLTEQPSLLLVFSLDPGDILQISGFLKQKVFSTTQKLLFCEVPTTSGSLDPAHDFLQHTFLNVMDKCNCRASAFRCSPMIGYHANADMPPVSIDGHSNANHPVTFMKFKDRHWSSRSFKQGDRMPNFRQRRDLQHGFSPLPLCYCFF